jgi:hypothetical protein
MKTNCFTDVNVSGSSWHFITFTSKQIPFFITLRKHFNCVVIQQCFAGKGIGLVMPLTLRNIPMSIN